MNQSHPDPSITITSQFGQRSISLQAEKAIKHRIKRSPSKSFISAVMGREKEKRKDTESQRRAEREKQQ